jgi:hypothetical protein
MRHFGLEMFLDGPAPDPIAGAGACAEGRAQPAPIRGGIEPPGPKPASPYMTRVPFVRLSVCVPADAQLLLNVEPPVKLI